MSSQQPANVEKRWFTALEIADAATRLGVAAVPQTDKGVEAMIALEGWKLTPFSRRRIIKSNASNIPILEYHCSIFPKKLKYAIEAEYQLDLIENTRIQRPKTWGQTLDQHYKLEKRTRLITAKSRQKILKYILDLQFEKQITRRQVILLVINNPRKYSISIDIIKNANSRHNNNRKISRSTIYKWFELYEKYGLQGLIPKPTKFK